MPSDAALARAHEVLSTHPVVDGHNDLPYALRLLSRYDFDRNDPAPDDVDGAVLCDADLAVLARDEDGYRRYVDDVRREYAHVPDELFRAGRATVLSALLAAPTLFRTDEGRRRWERAARANVEAELARLRVGDPG